MATHKELSASSTKDWSRCPGTIPLKKLFALPEVPSRVSLLGTAAHGLVELCLSRGKHPTEYLGQHIWVTQDGDYEKTATVGSNTSFQIDQEMIDAVHHMVYYVRTRLVELYPEKFSNPDDAALTRYAISLGVLRLEAKVNPLPDRSDTGGSADILIDAWPLVQEVVDYKHGAGVLVSVRSCPQTKSYLLGNAPANLQEYETYRHTICQPRHRLAPAEGGISSEDLVASDLAAFREELLQACARVDAARAVAYATAKDDSTFAHVADALYAAKFLLPGDQCTYCSFASDCPGARAAVSEALNIDFADPPCEILDSPCEILDLNERRRRVLDWATYIRKYLNNVEAKAKSALEQGELIDGYTLLPTFRHRAWHPGFSAQTLKARLADYGLSGDQIMETKMRSGPQLEKLIPKKQREQFAKELLYRPTGGYKMAPDTAAQEQEQISDFDNVED